MEHTMHPEHIGGRGWSTKHKESFTDVFRRDQGGEVCSRKWLGSG